MWEGMPLHFCGIIHRRCNIISVATLQNAALRLQPSEKTPNTIGQSYSNVWLNKRFFVAFRVITGIVNSTYKAHTLNQTRTWKRCSCGSSLYFIVELQRLRIHSRKLCPVYNVMLICYAVQHIFLKAIYYVAVV